MMTSQNDVTVTGNNVTVDVNDSSVYYYYDDYDYTAGDLLFYYVLWTITTPIVTHTSTVSSRLPLSSHLSHSSASSGTCSLSW